MGKLVRVTINEDKRLEPYKVWFTPTVKHDIAVIKAYNRNNIEGVQQLQNYLRELMQYISNPSLAWDNIGKYPHVYNGATHVNELGFNFLYFIKNSKFEHKDYVCVVKIYFNLDTFGLRNPFVPNGSNQGTITCVKLNRMNIDKIITETINSYLRKNLLLAS